MWSEVYRPEFLEGVIGHTEIKTALTNYLTHPPYTKVHVLHGPPGVGKTTMALAAIRSCGMDPLELNASHSLRSHADVETVIDSCRNSYSLVAMMRGDTRRICLVLDEVDGADPHAQRKLVQWLRTGERKTPILMTCNEVPAILKNNDMICIHRCLPPSLADIKTIFPNEDSQKLATECKYDIRRMFQTVQYGTGDSLPTATHPVGCSPEVLQILRQKMWTSKCPIQQAIANGNT